MSKDELIIMMALALIDSRNAENSFRVDVVMEKTRVNYPDLYKIILENK